MKKIFYILAILIFSSQASYSAETFGQSIKQGFERATEKTVDFGKKAGKQITDASITSEVKTVLLADDRIKAYGINVDTKRQVVYLKGSVPTASERSRAVSKTRGVKGVKAVVNMLRVGS
jgi:hyperosmotically inducible periplasmic protein